jgi:hypothetical protein
MVVAVTASGLGGVADAGAAGRGDGFCRRLRRDQQLLAASTPIGSEKVGRVLGELDRLARSAPRVIRREMALLVGLARKLARADPKDPNAFADIFAAIFDPKVITANAKVEKYALEVCKVWLQPLGGAGGSDVAVSPPGGPEAGSGMNASAIRAYLTATYGDAPWSGHVNGVGVGTGTGTQVEVDTDLARDKSASRAAVAICRATSTYVYDRQHVKDASISVVDLDQRPLARRSGTDGSCASTGAT